MYFKQFILKFINIPRRFNLEFYKRWNKILFSLKGIKYGNNLNVYCKVYVYKSIKAQIYIGNSFTFTSDYAINPLCRNIRGSIFVDRNAVLTIGDNTGISSACIWAQNKIIIGNNVKIGGDCILLDSDCHNLDYLIRRDNQKEENGRTKDSNTAKSKPIIIEDDVLIGTRCIVLKGVTIGARSVIGSGSVVTKSIPQDCIAAGNPCKVIRCFEKKISSHLEKY